jgi:hypothetical protein
MSKELSKPRNGRKSFVAAGMLTLAIGTYSLTPALKACSVFPCYGDALRICTNICNAQGGIVTSCYESDCQGVSCECSTC